MAKPVTAWAIDHDDGYIIVNTMRRTREEAISEFLKLWETYRSWRECKRKYGVKCIRVEIRPAGGSHE